LIAEGETRCYVVSLTFHVLNLTPFAFGSSESYFPTVLSTTPSKFPITLSYQKEGPMRIVYVFALIVLLAMPAFSQGTPGAGSFGLAVSFSGAIGSNVVTMSNGLSGVYWADNHWVITGGFALASIADNATIFTLSAGTRYHFNKNTLSPFIGGGMFLNIVSPSGAGAKSTTQFGLLMGGGAEYFVSRNFGMHISEGLQFSTEPTTFAFATKFGLEWYF
jgi:hypothetical protein